MSRQREWTVCVVLIASLTTAIRAQTAAPEVKLSDRQTMIEQQYRDFEAVVQRMADLLRQEDPERAALMMKVFARSKRDLVLVQMDKITKELEKGNLTEAAKLQDLIVQDMSELLALLLSENRAQELRERRERVEKYLEQLRDIKDQQRNLRLQTERSDSDSDAKDLAEKQQKLSEETEQLQQKIESEESKAKEEQGDRSEEKDGQGNKPEGDDAQKNEPGDGDDKPQSPQEQSPQDGKQDSSPQKSQDDQLPRAENLKNASRSMQDAKRQLEQLKRRRASEKQDEAIRELDKAIEELEELLRQLREEERQQLLATLEERFREMHDLQQVIYDSTVRLDQTPADKRTRVDKQQILALSRRESEIVTQAEQALLVLQDDGTALAFPEAVKQLVDDASLIASLLAKSDTGAFTQEVELAVLEALEEMILALEREQEESKKQQNQQQEGSQGSQQQALVQKLAELKMIRSLQQRINTRTTQLAEQGGQSEQLQGELHEAARRLAERQVRVYEVTREIALEMRGQ